MSYSIVSVELRGFHISGKFSGKRISAVVDEPFLVTVTAFLLINEAPEKSNSIECNLGYSFLETRDQWNNYLILCLYSVS